VYCKYDSSLSFFDFDVIYPTGRNDVFYCPCYTDFNGWTLLNYTQNTGERIFSSESIVSNTKAWIENVIFLNASFTVSGYNYLMDVQLKHCILQGDVICTVNDRTVSLWNSAIVYPDGYAVRESSITLDIYAENNNLALASHGSSSTPTIINSELTINAKCIKLGSATSTYKASLNRSIFKGEIECTSIGSYVFLSIINSIVDFKVNDTVATIPVSSSCEASVYNSDKITISKTGLTGVTSAQLLSPTALQAAGLPIGVDEDASD
jgi:hypothetical protein